MNVIKVSPATLAQTMTSTTHNITKIIPGVAKIAHSLVETTQRAAKAVRNNTVKSIHDIAEITQDIANVRHTYFNFAYFNTAVAPHLTHFWLLALLVGVIFVSQIAAIIEPVLGVYATFAALVTCMVLALKNEVARMVAISTGIIPMATLISLCLPQSNTFSQMIVFYDAILLLALVYRFMFTLDEPVERTSLGARGYLTSLPTILVLGQLLGLFAYMLLKSHYPYAGSSFGLVAACAVVFAIAEEMLFRGLIQQRASKVLQPHLAAALSAALFALLGLGTGNLAAFTVALATGTIASIIYYKKQNLLLTIIFNATSKLIYLGLLATFAWNYF